MIFRHAHVLLFFLALFPFTVEAKDAILDSVIAAARTQGINGEAPDWPVVEREAYALLAKTPGEAGRTAAIRHVLAALDDGHSFYIPPAAASGAAHAPVPDGASAPLVPPPIAVAHDTVQHVGHLEINAWSGPRSAIPAATQQVRDALNLALADARCGLVIDVAKNSGGNMYPMMGGIAPLYDDGVLETFQGRGAERQVVNVHAGQLRVDDNVFPRAELAAAVRKPGHIAILLGPGTMSSGEILALGFKGQRNVRFFGRATHGATTANQSIPLENGGMVALTTARILDRQGSVHHGPVVPDDTTQPPLPAARAWLRGQCAKR